MDVLIGAGISLLTLALNAVFGRAAARATQRSSAHDTAGELLADHVKFVWDKGPEAWINLQAYLARLRGPLHRAGVPNRLYVDLREKVTEMWNHLEYVDDLESWTSSNARADAVTDAVDAIYAALEIKPPWWRRPLS
jgi:hypothetical protein